MSSDRQADRKTEERTDGDRERKVTKDAGYIIAQRLKF